MMITSLEDVSSSFVTTARFDDASSAVWWGSDALTAEQGGMGGIGGGGWESMSAKGHKNGGTLRGSEIPNVSLKRGKSWRQQIGSWFWVETPNAAAAKFELYRHFNVN